MLGTAIGHTRCRRLCVPAYRASGVPDVLLPRRRLRDEGRRAEPAVRPQNCTHRPHTTRQTLQPAWRPQSVCTGAEAIRHETAPCSFRLPSHAVWHGVGGSGSRSLAHVTASRRGAGWCPAGVRGLSVLAGVTCPHCAHGVRHVLLLLLLLLLLLPSVTGTPTSSVARRPCTTRCRRRSRCTTTRPSSELRGG